MCHVVTTMFQCFRTKAYGNIVFLKLIFSFSVWECVFVCAVSRCDAEFMGRDAVGLTDGKKKTTSEGL